MNRPDVSWGRVAATLAAAGVIAVVAGSVFIWSGLYNIAASTDHLGLTTWVLEKVRDQSIETQAASIDPPRLLDQDMVRLGAAHFEGGCVPCHGRPGEKINPIVSRMLPSPPDLARAAPQRKTRELFWIVKHGLKYTGMPAWPSMRRDDEVWALAAFLDTLPATPQQYRELSGVNRLGRDASKALAGDGAVLRQCSRCHDAPGLDTNGHHVPRLAGMPRAYLIRSLNEYAHGIRPSGIMQPVAGLLSPGAIETLANHYSALRPLARSPAGANRKEALRRGANLARRGAPANDVPACLGCHSDAGTGRFPPLSGQHAEYLQAQLKLFRSGGRAQTPLGQTMSVIASRLSEEEIFAVSIYFSSLASEQKQHAVSSGSRP